MLISQFQGLEKRLSYIMKSGGRHERANTVYLAVDLMFVLILGYSVGVKSAVVSFYIYLVYAS